METTNEIYDIIWLSVDPLRHKIDYYPKYIAEKIEKNLIEKKNCISKNINSLCVLGSDFFNATIHYNSNSNIFYQTTSGFSLGRAGFKQPGYRSVRRVILPCDKKVTIFCKFVNGELRITDSELNSDKTFNETVPYECIIKNNSLNNSLNNSKKILAWKPENLEPNDLNLETNVVIWQWCRGIREKHGDLMKLEEEWWEPYLYEQNLQIEDAFSNNRTSTTIVLPIDNTVRNIEFTHNTAFAKQKDVVNNKERLIRRKIVTIKELIELIYNINKKPIDISLLQTLVSDDEIPHEFFCCISQDIMIDPVKTVDGFTYDRNSIEKWFETSCKSPLTGLELQSKTLTPNYDIKKKIKEFTKLKLT